MKIIDLTDDYIQLVIKLGDYNAYEKLCPELFEHYYTFWSQKNISKIISESELLSSRELILSAIPKIENQFSILNIDIQNMTIILFVGMGNTNGHACKYHDKFVVWIPVETYTNKIDAEVFLTHEIAHALHYAQSSNFYFENQLEQKHIGRQLITEGLATFFSKIVLNVIDEKALWGKYLVGDDLTDWIIACDNQFESIKIILKNNFDSTDDSLGLFYANDKNDILNFRAGYYVGLRLVEQFVKAEKITLSGLLLISRERFEKEIYSML